MANLEESDYQIILDFLRWLNSDIIHMAKVLLHEAKPALKVFSDLHWALQGILM